jgi:spore germination cell wall hydrolase CwlJ-like protein
MSIIRKVSALVAVYALTVLAPGHAEDAVEKTVVSTQEVIETQVAQQAIKNPSTIQKIYEGASDRLGEVIKTLTEPLVDFKVSNKDVDCLARNIFYEAGGEPEEGKVAVALVTINRVRDGKFGKTICEVVNQRTMFVYSSSVKTTEIVQRGLFGGAEPVTKTHVVISYVPVCQFSWVCAFIRKPVVTDNRWIESQRIATAVLAGEYDEWGAKYYSALYFHSTGIRPGWASRMKYLNRVGGHIFYAEKI